jgi:hypothetical protein
MKAIVTDEKGVLPGQQCKILREFNGPDAALQAAEYIGTLPEYETGRYGIDACIPGEGHCTDCGCGESISRSRLKPGMVIRVTCKNDEGRGWTEEGIVQAPSWCDMLILDGPDGHIDWTCVVDIELVSWLPPEED